MAEVVWIVPGELAASFRLAGVAALSARNAAELLEHVRDLQGRAETVLVLFAEAWLTGLAPEAYGRLMSSDHPYFIPLPIDWRASSDARTGLESQLGRLLGCRISLGGHLAGGGARAGES